MIGMLPDILITDVAWHVPIPSAREWLDTLSEQDVAAAKTKLGFDADDSLDDVAEYLSDCARTDPTLFDEVVRFETPLKVEQGGTSEAALAQLNALGYPWGVADFKMRREWSNDRELNDECDCCYDLGIDVETIVASMEAANCAPTTFITMADAVEYVRQTLGEFEDSFDVEGFADAVVGTLPNGIYYIKYYGAEYWDVARDFERKVD